ncbi:MAG: hydantoinase/oxoprolinase family protein [Pseudomonadota bacterium]
MKRLGVDTGGTFTDLVLVDEGGVVHTRKVLSTPEAPERAILTGMADLGLDPADPGLEVIHGTTVATNAVLEGRGARTVFITNRGFADLLTIGRQARAELYELQPPAVEPPVPPDHCLELGGRLGPAGEVIEPLDEAELAELAERVAALAPEAVAIDRLFAFLDPEEEERIAAALPAGPFVSRSSAVLAEIREYERGIATWLNARLGPVVQGYLQRLAAALPGPRIAVMQSHAGTCDIATAGSGAVRLLLSGPAGGLAAAGRTAEGERQLTFDMGGTSTDVALVAGEPRITTEGRIGPWPVAVPQVEMHTIGAGGGSIAGLDAGGILRVGPASAGADPGPACYGRGGTEPTVTDANVVLGRLPAGVALGGDLALDGAAARAAVGGLGEALGRTPEAAAEGILAVACERMAEALRVVSVQRGEDPAAMTLTSFGGAGGLHVCEVAERLGVTRARVPARAGLFSAVGMLVAPWSRVLSRSRREALAGAGPAVVEAVLAELRAEGEAAFADDGGDPAALVAAPRVELRYTGQSHALAVDWVGDAAAAEAAFHEAHRHLYGHALDLPVELVTVRLHLRGPLPPVPPAEAGRAEGGEPAERVAVHGVDGGVPLLRREALSPGQEVPGPALVVDAATTVWVAQGWRAAVAGGELRLAR